MGEEAPTRGCSSSLFGSFGAAFADLFATFFLFRLFQTKQIATATAAAMMAPRTQK